MSLEQHLLRKSSPDFARLIAYGFERNGQDYGYSAPILAGDFRAEISISAEGKLSGRVFELSSGTEYDNIHIPRQQGEFVNRVRTAYLNLLQDIVEHCFIPRPFVSEQANRLAQILYERYGDKPHFPWVKYPDFGVFKHRSNDKWYALCMYIERNKLIPKAEGKTDVLNLKADSKQIANLCRQDGIYPAYHMNKQHWISLILDDTLDDRNILALIAQSYALTASGAEKSVREGRKEWLIPANPKYFDIEKAFCQHREIPWKQSTAVAVNDILYMYVGAPRSAIMYKCLVTQTDLPYHGQHRHLNIKRVMNIRLLQSYAPHLFTLAKLKEFQVNAIRGPRNMPLSLREYIEKTAGG
ncbi:putative DNA-binding protein (MmcQ/YjbR family) [Mesocricetibacter intestinalis]|uniref:Putative DNA-binding protein (MmcQ/YjbR family) n=1 Tax=Mesocricetibacter intestinalis TaxID=1521930 RepID=A0A4R6VC04_9PAST|nr:MmcQ/YjbR family DNA-binding protein [Mesocricetibacter intestinalis]TDQ59436.1 putative DNA-binding protein (MmcQ/YjbR family) [Mesocricetibacter intestinalis]